MKKIAPKKLALKKEVIRVLTEEELKQAVGGATALGCSTLMFSACQCTPTVTCPSFYCPPATFSCSTCP